MISQTLKYHAAPIVLIHLQMVGMMHKCNLGKLLTRAAFIHQNNSSHVKSKHYAALKALNKYLSHARPVQPAHILNFPIYNRCVKSEHPAHISHKDSQESVV